MTEKPNPGIIAWHAEQAREAEAMRRIYAGAIRRSSRDEGDEVRVLPNGLKVVGRPGGWEQLTRRAHEEAAGNASTDEFHNASHDPDSIAEENRILGTPAARVVARADCPGPSIF